MLDIKNKMKEIIIILIIIFSLSQGCSNQKNLLQSNKREIITTQSSNLDKNILESWRRQKEFFIKNSFEIIDWDETKNILLREKIKGGKQYHTGWLTIYTTDGSKYLVKQPKMDALWEFMEAKGIKLEGFGTE
ncbi:MAG: hypothetical protein AB1393_07965 [Candidatus Edwardsbacteria bacterium]